MRSANPIFKAHVRNQYSLREVDVSFEMWTSEKFYDEALVKLKAEKVKRTKAPIYWRDGNNVLKIARNYKMKAITGALETHHLKHPLV